jgi:hypothetical protein
MVATISETNLTGIIKKLAYAGKDAFNKTGTLLQRVYCPDGSDYIHSTSGDRYNVACPA